ncbi:topoisomerase DNA-binding C4 zinc finger domain-containing protein [Catenovulum sp. 2E275]|uniref:DNA topoisomerase family protein n=1 Tax=Catenovulum sp. 2E275 TaxID=2980497 RepID=UPI0021D1E1F1|nr:topoisomerase DNA-binding C4 zinc finger domain-containing protein [Catenovulum sp. 2E275]MCU4675881.1 topoisomerase DNA-binding C4 zinc finger domain-containing protein [Catenovulum sp. 2E275]
MSDKTPELFSNKAHALDKEFHTCPECGGELVFRSGKKGPFLGCSQYPSCDYIKPLYQEQAETNKIIEGSECPKCQHELAVKHGRYGIFIGCTNFPACDFVDHTDQEQTQNTNIQCPKCNKGELTQRQNRFGKLFYACSAYPDCNYALNFKPVAHSCPECDWPVMMEKTLRGQSKLVCPQKKCGHKIDRE